MFASGMLFDPFRFDHQIKSIRKIFLRRFRFVRHSLTSVYVL